MPGDVRLIVQGDDFGMCHAVGYLAGLTPGVHLLVTHCAAPGAELAALHAPGTETYRWAEEYRLSDQAVVTDSGIRKAIEERGIRLVSIRDAFTG